MLRSISEITLCSLNGFLKMSDKAPKERDSIAQRNALGLDQPTRQALKGRDKIVLSRPERAFQSDSAFCFLRLCGIDRTPLKDRSRQRQQSVVGNYVHKKNLVLFLYRRHNAQLAFKLNQS